MVAKNVLVVELNEFNHDLMMAALKQHDFPALSKVFNFPNVNYKTQDRYNSGYLEPWVQWVSVHTGVPSLVHGIKHLGDVPHLDVEQCWETLSRHGVTTGVWGVMNGEKRRADKALFFLPDPWTFSEWGAPNDLDNLLRLPRYIAKNYQNLKKSKIALEAIKLLKFVMQSGAAKKIFKEAFNLIAPLKKFGFKHFVFISCFDYISTLLFIQNKQKYQPQCSYLFLNSIAHLQHHHWKEGPDAVTPEILLGLQYLEKVFQALFKAFPNDAIVVHNGLSQMNTNHEKPWVLYRQKDPVQFLKALQIPALRVEQHMTHDGHVFFENAEQCEIAYQNLRNATIEEKSLFHVEKNQSDPCKLFYMLKFTDELCPTSDISFHFNHKTYNFFEHFDRIVTRTGRHIPMGKVFSDTITFPNHMQNHDFNKYIYHYLLPESFPLAPIQEEITESELEYELV